MVIFEEDFITVKGLFKTTTYDWPSIESVSISASEVFTLFFILGRSFESTSIRFTNGSKLVLWNDIYSNLPRIRAFIIERSKEKVKDLQSHFIAAHLPAVEGKKYRGNPFININSFLLAAMAVLFTTTMTGKHPASVGTKIALAIAGLSLYIIFGIQMNYFIIQQGCLRIRNHYFPWKNKMIPLADIIEVDIETPEKRSTSLRVYTKDYRSGLYSAGSLQSSHWKSLQDDLAYLGIAIRPPLR